jgi:uncharacterized phage protein (TIGR01671 family)
MDREIKFRAWDKVNKRIISWEKFTKSNYPLNLFSHIQDYYWEMMQYTGIKDKNGKEIYESDIVKNRDEIRLVKWRNYGFSFIPIKNAIGIMTCVSGRKRQNKTSTFEVIGNIYENPELLEVKPCSTVNPN